MQRRFADAEPRSDIPQRAIRFQVFVNGPPLGVGTDSA